MVRGWFSVGGGSLVAVVVVSCDDTARRGKMLVQKGGTASFV